MSHKLSKVALINPPVPDGIVWIREGRCQQWDIWGAPFPPFSLAMISTQLEREGVQTTIIDSGPERKNASRVIEQCKKEDIDIVILTTTSPTIETDLGWFAVELKLHLPNLLIIAIGIHVSSLPEEVFRRYKELDYAIMGEPELSCKDLVLAISEGKEINGIKGVAFRTGVESVKVNEERPFKDNIDEYGFPNWNKINFSNYPLPIKKRPFSLISFSRGCPYTCKFCATHTYNGSILRKRSINALIEEIHFNLSLGVKDFLCWTELMTFDRRYLNSFLDSLMNEGMHKKIEWVCNSRVDGSDLTLFKKMKAAGCWQVAFGYEFGDERILQLADKGGKATVEQGRIAAEAAHQAGLIVDGHFIMGYPGETKESLQATIDYACSLKLTFAHFYACVPIPGSRLYKESVDQSWFNGSDWAKLNQDKASISTPQLCPEMVQAYIRKAYKRFYIRPCIMMRGLKIPKSLNEYMNFAKLGIGFYKDLTS